MCTHLQHMNNPVTDEQVPPPPAVALQLQPFSCDRHPDDSFSGFCPSCLCERLSIVDQSSQELGGDEEEEEVKEEEMSDLEKDILEMEAKIDAIVDNLKSVNDLDVHSKSSNFWSKKWRRKKKKNGVDRQSEVADYGSGPRFSLDAGRASWDGYLIGRSFPPPGGSTQTREYCLNYSSSSGRRKGLERSNSMVVDTQNVDYSRRLKFHSIGGEKELAGDDDDDDGLVKKPLRWWNWNWNWNWKVWGNRTSKNGEFNPSNSRRNNKCQGDDEFVSEINNGLLRFYLTRGSRRRSATGTGTGALKTK